MTQVFPPTIWKTILKFLHEGTGHYPEHIESDFQCLLRATSMVIGLVLISVPPRVSTGRLIHSDDDSDC